jgi:hypothetical protein
VRCSAARTALHAIEKDARKSGYMLMARKAAGAAAR